MRERKIPMQVVSPRQVPMLDKGGGTSEPRVLLAPTRPTRIPTRDFTVDLAEYLIDAIHQRAEQSKPRCTERYVVMQGLRAIGFEIEDADMVADARRRRL
ncbi:MAG: hypothetical protein R3D57_16090 [Hyphomicrobiaceae bacterium]